MNDNRSYYAASANPTPQRDTLRDEITVDVCVVGAGIAGCSTALHLAERGYRVAVIEAQQVAWGASGRSGGQALFGFASGQDVLVSQLGRDTARQMFDVSVAALDLLKDRVRRHGIDCDLHWGQMHAAIKKRQIVELQTWQSELEQDYGYPSLTWFDEQQTQRLVGSQRYIGGLYDSKSGHLHPLNYTLGLAAAAESAGAQIFENSPVSRIEHGDPVSVVTAQGRVRAAHVALCCNAYIGGLVPELRARIMPVGTYIVATEPLGAARAATLLSENVAITDINFVLDYFRLSADHRLLFGGRVSYSGLDARNTLKATRARMLKVFPQLADTRIDYAWGGFVDITMNRAPDFGRLAPNVYYLQGFSGHGIALTGMAGQLVAEAIQGQAERFDMFGRIEHRKFPGGPALRTPLLVLAMAWFRLRDLL